MTTTRGMVAVLLLVAVAACSGDDAWTYDDYVATYDTNGDGAISADEGPLCDAADCTVRCHVRPSTGVLAWDCFNADASGPIEHGGFSCIPDCSAEGEATLCADGSGVPACLLPWDDARAIR